MIISRQTRYLAAWIACIALLLASVLPAVFHASMTRSHAVVSVPTEICTTSAVKPVVMVDVQKSLSSPQEKHDAHGEDCSYCRVQWDSAGLPPIMDPVAYLPLDLFPLPSLFYHSPRPLFAWASAQPRAPPYRF
jgi:hypothetical protein